MDMVVVIHNSVLHVLSLRNGNLQGREAARSLLKYCWQSNGRPYFNRLLDIPPGSASLAAMSKPVKDVAPAAEGDINLPFEEALKRLEGIVESMENDDLPLEMLLSKYEEGTKLAQSCQARLAEAEVKIQQLERKSNGQFALKPLTPGADAREE
jgi:exodeoxyribonuclease VII small subunit